MDVMTNAHRKVILNMSRAERQLADQTVKAEIIVIGNSYYYMNPGRGVKSSF
ncbi:hypothetical protein BFJ63_vAg129 [Fusarium oxysporum f. sp. narcissi]|jgi:hypothetical protein|uniref:Uncharacterized protein n=3 Tax=Fusarium oxysporum TaxID=5507 RepID=A0A420S152_FUSOX|nr:hypothetical protein BFJ65_g6962 [Fusarium oxysporum f. sp. cepae]RKK65150.1 hypothetical protein BFJ67_g137 [Fusarium oxysporum f. sp. cepae]RKL23002.1 hypothetical protein BFJ68_g1206 [Fusarium oxysporum]RYC96963.1 hypothetical protein BFJ63_vAg129 [Fusarium oxysporum f. sp. narcissi]